MAIDETELPNVPADALGHDAPTAEASSRFNADDFRLRLDSPLFHRDPGMAATQVPQLRQLTWEHVVRPSQQTAIIDSNTVPSNTVLSNTVLEETPLPSLDASSATTPSIESLLERARDAEEPHHFVEQPQAVEPLYSMDDAMDMVPVLPVAAPRAESLFAALEQMDEAPNATATESFEVSDELPAVAPAEVVAPPPAPASAVEAELNRLAFLPDQEEEPGPVVVPEIAHTEQRVDTALPSLSQHDLYTARNAAPANHARLNLVDVATTFTPVSRKKKRNGFVRLATFLVFVGLLAGAAYAGKYYFLDKRWEGDTKDLASEVEVARGLSFDHAIKVTSLPAADYASRLVTSSFGLDTDALATEASAWRALGILDGPLNEGKIGMAALPDAPAFYDPTVETIFVAQDMPADLYRFGMHRALAIALLDQEYGWSARAKDTSPSVSRGIMAYYDADALAVAVGMTTPAERTDIVTQIFGLYGKYSIDASPSPFASTVSGRLGVALRPYFESTTDESRVTQDKSAAPTDGQVLDLRRLTSGVVETTAKTSEGMLFWYHALAGRIDENTAWEAALAWQNDDVSTVEGPTGVCVVAYVQVSQTSLDAVNAAFQAWAAAAPAGSGTTVTLTTDGSPMQLQINACDPGPGVPTTPAAHYLALGGAPLRAEQFRLLLAAQPTLSAAQVACAVFGGDPVSVADERGVIENAEGWSGPASHPAPDPNRLGCAPA